jgi:hypothetical protein
MLPNISDNRANLCEKHQDKPPEFYCNDHKSVMCYVCATLEHKQCNVDYIPDVSENMSVELNGILQQMESLVIKCISNTENIDKAAQNLDQSHAKVVEDIKVMRKERNECLDRMETEILEEADTVVKNAKYKQETVKATSFEIMEELQCSYLSLNTLREENKQTTLFIEMKNATKRLQILTDKEKQVIEANTADDCIQFTRNPSLIDGIKTLNNYGILSTRVHPSSDRALDLQYSHTVNVKSASDKKECNITGMVMIAPKKLIVADYNNNSIKLIDVENGSIILEERMPSKTYEAIKLLGNTLAVTSVEEKSIQILSYNDTGLSLHRHIAVSEACHGLAYCQNKFVFSSWKVGKLSILNLDGDVLNVFGSPTLFHGPLRVISSNDEKFLYVSDAMNGQNHKVMKIDFEGNVKNVFEEPGYEYPYGLQQLEDDTTLVTYRGSDTVLRLSSSLKRCEIVGLDKVNIYQPKALTYCDREHKLYVSCSTKKGQLNADIVKVFNQKWI